MDLMQHDNLVEDVIDAGKALKTTAGNVLKGIRDRAKAKDAQKTADAGQYWTLRPYLKSLIPIPQYIITQVSGQGITEYAVMQLPEQNVGASNTMIIQKLKELSGTGGAGATSNINPTGASNVPITTDADVSGFDFKKYLPYILGAAVLGLAVYFISKK